MKIKVCFYLFSTLSLLLLSCGHTEEQNPILIDLDKTTEEIRYSDFVDSISYIELNTRDSCIVSDIEKIYMDNDTILIWDEQEAGILTFDDKGKLVNQLNHYGQGPGEFITITAFCIDPQTNTLLVWDYPSQRINKYTYSGEFLGYNRCELFVRDFTPLNRERKLCILPFYSESHPSGIWISDSTNHILKDLEIPVPMNDKVEFSGTYYNVDGDSIFIYDRNYDYLYKVCHDSIERIYSFQVSQSLDRDLRKRDPATLLPFKDIAYMSNFSLSENFLLQTYHYYDNTDNPNVWVLYDRNSEKISISKEMINDIDHVETQYPHIFYLNKKKWCRVVETDVNNCNILLQLLHLK